MFFVSHVQRKNQRHLKRSRHQTLHAAIRLTHFQYSHDRQNYRHLISYEIVRAKVMLRNYHYRTYVIHRCSPLKPPQTLLQDETHLKLMYKKNESPSFHFHHNDFHIRLFPIRCLLKHAIRYYCILQKHMMYHCLRLRHSFFREKDLYHHHRTLKIRP